MKIIKLVFFLFLITFANSSYSVNEECNKFKELTLKELESEISSANNSEQAHELYLYGECKVVIAKLILKRFEGSKIINQHLLHKGMSLGYIASVSLEKLQGK